MRKLVACASILVGLSASSYVGARGITIEERLQAEQAIERVYWSHRIWPQDNPHPKPPFDAVLSGPADRAKIDDYLRASNALGVVWHSPITGVQLQAELARMSAETRDPKLLNELFTTLGNDPFIIAECLARPILADRLIRNRYARDNRFHGAVKTRAEAELAATDVGDMQRLSANYSEVTWAWSPSTSGSRIASNGVGAVVALSEEEWNAKLRELAALFANTGDSSGLVSNRISSLQESDEAFFAVAILESAPDHVKTATMTWPKRPFEVWWGQTRSSFAIDAAVADATYALASPTQNACVNDSWRAIPSGVPEARAFHTAVWTGVEMIVWGGGLGAYMQTGGRYYPATDTWMPTSLGASVPSGRIQHTAVWTGSEMIVWGGYSVASPVVTRYNSGGRYNPATDTWAPTQVDGNTPAPRYLHTAIWTGSEMIVWGGTNDASTLGTGGRYDPVTDTWRSMSTGADSPGPRRNHTAVWTGSEMIIWGWSSNAGKRYDPTTDSWHSMSTGPGVPTSRFNHHAVWTGSEMIVWGGYTGSAYTNTGGRYDPISDAWVPTSTGANVPATPDGMTAVWAQDEMIVWGAPNGTGARYFPLTDSWQPTSSAPGVPSARQAHTALWTGSEMIVWGGRDPTRFIPTETGGRYDPLTDRWTPTSIGAEIPTPRWGHAAVWTGTEMIVWGGGSDWPPLDTGGRYRPATNSWAPTNRGANLPAARRNHVAVWTGREMVLWGGDGVGGFLDSAGRYDPGIDAWGAASSVNAPIGRSGPTVVWTGTEMIVWGGYDYLHDSSPTNTGGRYDPSSDHWMSTPEGGTGPRARLAHSAVWTGNEMIVWGGAGEAGYENTGDRYEPGTNTWRTTSTASGVPTVRTGHSAIWTGHDMIVFGGATPPASDSGARYDPVMDAWTPIASGAGVPSARWMHTALWTGNEMIIWGGWDGSNSLRTGGRYDLATNAWSSTSTAGDAPLAHVLHSAVWTGRSMLVWGGTPSPSSGGSYCACPDGRLVYRDADGDGFGSPASSIPRCDGSAPVGYVIDATDCDDHDASAHPGATEVCNGEDDDCNGSIDDDSALCDDDLVCTDDVCGGAEGCFHTGNSNACDDGDACTTGDICGGGACIGGSAPNCNDGNVCTDDSCNPATGCVHTDNALPCDDVNACTTGDRCGGGHCNSGGPANCDDGSCCTIDSCEPAAGCRHTANTTAPVFTHQPSLGACPTLWPPDHTYVDFTVPDTGAAATSSCGVATIQFASCSSSQPENGSGTGDGNTTRDCVYEAGALHVRAERDGACSPIGRVYETTLVAIDVCGNSTTSNPIDIGVFHDRGNPPPGGTVYAGSGNNHDTRSGTNGTYGLDCGAGGACVNGTAHDRSDVDPEMEISQEAAVSVGDLLLGKASGGSVQLTWSDPTLLAAVHVTTYHVWILDPDTLIWTLLAQVDKHTTTYLDPILNDGAEHDYKVTAVIK